jgi:hypothetical protein
LNLVGAHLNALEETMIANLPAAVSLLAQAANLAGCPALKIGYR